MKTSRFPAMLLAMLPLLQAAQSPSLAASESPHPIPGATMGFDIEVWTDRGEGAVYRVGDRIGIYFRANRDCHVVLYDINTEGDVRLLFPQYPDDGFVYGGVTYRLPDYYESGSWRVGGPRGVEFIHAVATTDASSFRFGTRAGSYHFGFDPVRGDPFVAINSINDRIIAPGFIRAVATASFFVDGRVWYPRYACASCHHGRPILDPYASVCPRYSVVVAHGYDYWWSYDYYPARVGFVFGGPFWRFEIRAWPVHRHRRTRYLDCAWGFGNYHPLVAPSRPHTVVVRKDTRVETHRSYTRDYRPVTYTETRARSQSPRDAGNTRTRAATGGETRVRSESALDETTSGGTRTRTDIQTATPTRTRESSVAPSTRARESSAETSTRARASKPDPAQPSTVAPSRSRETVPAVQSSRSENPPSERSRERTSTSGSRDGNSASPAPAGDTRDGGAGSRSGTGRSTRGR